MPKINVYLPEDLAAAVRDAQVPVSAVCQAALERAVRDVVALRGGEADPVREPAHGPFTRFTPRARTAIALAQDRAREHHHDHVGPEHLLLGILDEGANLALRVLSLMDVEPDDLRAELIASLEPSSSGATAKAPFTPLAKQVLQCSADEAVRLGHNYIGCEHLLLGLLVTEEGLAGQVLRRMGMEPRTARRAVVTALTGSVNEREERPRAAGTLEQILRRLEAIERRLDAS
jgi:ATP-dependent Clp protease ATP-binding subunit ClpA